MRLAIEHRVMPLRKIGIALIVVAAVSVIACPSLPVAALSGVIALLGAGLLFSSSHLILGSRTATVGRLQTALGLLSVPLHEEGSSLRAGKGVRIHLRGSAPFLLFRLELSEPQGKAQNYLREVLLKSQRSFARIGTGG